MVGIFLNAVTAASFDSGPNQVALLELYTSEGCSSCPPAEEWVSKLKQSPLLWSGIVPVVYHVHYWDNLGWPDLYAASDYTVRQRLYAAAWGNDSIYTPGFVLSGKEWRGWRGEGSPVSAAQPDTGRLHLDYDNGKAHITFVPSGTNSKGLRAYVVLLGTDIVSDIGGGENRGRRLVHDFTVLAQASAAMIDADAGFSATVEIHSDTRDKPTCIAAWVAQDTGLPILQAVGGWLSRSVSR